MRWQNYSAFRFQIRNEHHDIAGPGDILMLFIKLPGRFETVMTISNDYLTRRNDLLNSVRGQRIIQTPEDVTHRLAILQVLVDIHKRCIGRCNFERLIEE